MKKEQIKAIFNKELQDKIPEDISSVSDLKQTFHTMLENYPEDVKRKDIIGLKFSFKAAMDSLPKLAHHLLITNRAQQAAFESLEEVTKQICNPQNIPAVAPAPVIFHRSLVLCVPAADRGVERKEALGEESLEAQENKELAEAIRRSLISSEQTKKKIPEQPAVQMHIQYKRQEESVATPTPTGRVKKLAEKFAKT